MANYLTTDTDLTTVANAIRTKGGTSEPLSFPSGFATAIANIPSGGVSEWEEIDMGGTVYGTYDVYAILYQAGNMMEATATIQVGSRTETYSGDSGKRCIHFKNVPYNTTVKFGGDGDNVSYGWVKMNVYGKVATNYVQQSSTTGLIGSTNCSIDSNTVPGILYVIVFSPET